MHLKKVIQLIDWLRGKSFYALDQPHCDQHKHDDIPHPHHPSSRQAPNAGAAILEAEWNLRLDPLDDQSDETKQYLFDLLSP